MGWNIRRGHMNTVLVDFFADKSSVTNFKITRSREGGEGRQKLLVRVILLYNPALHLRQLWEWGRTVCALASPAQCVRHTYFWLQLVLESKGFLLASQFFATWTISSRILWFVLTFLQNHDFTLFKISLQNATAGSVFGLSKTKQKIKNE